MSKWDRPTGNTTDDRQPVVKLTQKNTDVYIHERDLPTPAPIVAVATMTRTKPKPAPKNEPIPPALEADRQIALTGLRQIRGYKTWRDKPVMRLVLDRAIHVLETLGGDIT